MKKVAVIILNYNGKKYLSKLLESIFNYSPKLVEQEIIVVDNNSADDSVGWLKTHYPKISLLLQAKNLGFAEGNNVGLRYAINNGFDYAMLLNQDTIIEPGYLDKLAIKIESAEATASVQPKILLYPLTDLVNSLGNVIHFLGFGYTFGHKMSDSKITITNDEVNYCAGAACLIKIEALKKVGLFNSSFFMYHEDLDLGWRFRLSGYKNLIEQKAVVYHQYEFSRSIKKFYFMERNRYLTIFQNYKLLTIILILPALILMELGLFVFSFKNGWWLEKLKVYLFFLNPHNWRKLLKARSQVQAKRLKSDREVVKDFSGLILHQEIANDLLEKVVNPVFNYYWQVVKRLIIW